MTRKPLSRRDFLKAAGLSLAGASVACSGLGFAATRAPGFDTPELQLGKEDSMNKNILVTYATRAGSTVEIASAIGETLASRGYRVEVKPVKSRPALQGYDAVVLGSAIRMGNWLPEMLDFVRKNQPALQGMPVAVFTAHILNSGADQASREARAAYTTALKQLISPAAEVFFTGKMDYASLSFLDRIIAQAVEKQTGVPAGDHRDWNQIRAWAGTILA